MLLESISDDAPCGVDLEYDSDFAKLESLFPGEQETQMGDSVIEAQEPDWNEIINLCESLLEKSKDLNLLVYFCIASLEVRGIFGLSEGIQLLKDIVVRYWDHLYPQLDTDEPEDQRYIERINILDNLSKPFKSFGDDFKMIERVRNLPISDSKQVGQFSLAHILAAKENKPMPNGSAAPTLALIEASFQSTDQSLLLKKLEAADSIIAAIDELDSFLEGAVGAENSVHLENLKNEIEMLQKILNEFVSGTDNTADKNPGKKSSKKPTGSGAEGAVPVSEFPNTFQNAMPASEIGSGSREIRTREDVIQAIDRILAYYPRYEPGSPVPFLLRRARRLVSLDFMQLMGDLAPSAKSDLESLLGSSAKDEKNPENEASKDEGSSSW